MTEAASLTQAEAAERVARISVERYDIDLWFTSRVFEPGHRIRVSVSSALFPKYDRNLNTGGNNFDESKAIVARNSVHHSDKYLSRIRLPVSPAR